MSFFKSLPVLIAAALTAGAASAQKTSKEQFPAGFNPAKDTLLIEYIPESSPKANYPKSGYDNWTYYFMRKNGDEMEKYAAKSFGRPYKLVTQHDIYTDSSFLADGSYRYALVSSLLPVENYMRWREDLGRFQSTSNQPIFQYFILDRKEGVTYAPLSRGSSLIMWAYKQALRKVNDK